LGIFLGEKMGKINANSRKNVNNKKIEIIFLKEIKLILMIRILKVFLII
jgi:hypothetical protein